MSPHWTNSVGGPPSPSNPRRACNETRGPCQQQFAESFSGSLRIPKSPLPAIAVGHLRLPEAAAPASQSKGSVALCLAGFKNRDVIFLGGQPSCFRQSGPALCQKTLHEGVRGLLALVDHDVDVIDTVATVVPMEVLSAHAKAGQGESEVLVDELGLHPVSLFSLAYRQDNDLKDPQTKIFKKDQK